MLADSTQSGSVNAQPQSLIATLLPSGRYKLTNSHPSLVMSADLVREQTGLFIPDVEQFEGNFRTAHYGTDQWINLQIIIGMANLKSGRFPSLAVIKGNAVVSPDAYVPVLEIVKGDVHVSCNTKIPEIVIAGGGVYSLHPSTTGVDLGRLRFVGGEVSVKARPEDFALPDFCKTRMGIKTALKEGVDWLKHQESLRKALRDSGRVLDDLVGSEVAQGPSLGL